MNCFQEKKKKMFSPYWWLTNYIIAAKDPLKRNRIEKLSYHPKNAQYLKDQKQQHKVRQELNQKTKAHAH